MFPETDRLVSRPPDSKYFIDSSPKKFAKGWKERRSLKICWEIRHAMHVLDLFRQLAGAAGRPPNCTSAGHVTVYSECAQWAANLRVNRLWPCRARMADFTAHSPALKRARKQCNGQKRENKDVKKSANCHFALGNSIPTRDGVFTGPGAGESGIPCQFSVLTHWHDGHCLSVWPLGTPTTSHLWSSDSSVLALPQVNYP